jgi:chemotaxis protein CheX
MEERHMEFKTEDIFEIARTIWEATLLTPIALDESGSIGNRPRAIASCIQITGAWNGAVLLDCTIEAAQSAAKVMFGVEPADLSAADTQDAIAELSNMIGGNIKALVSGKCFLSLPAVVEGGDYRARVPGARMVNRVSFTALGQTIMITVLEKNAKERTAAA